VACNFSPNESLKYNPKIPHHSILFILHMTPTPSTIQKKALGKLFLSYYIAQKKGSKPKYFLANVDHGSSNVCQKMHIVHPPAVETLACAQSGASLP
jgi:hypothetical protein